MSVIADRDTGQYPLSIATSLAIEGSIGTHPDHPAGKYKLSDFPVVMANMKTLFRNYYEAIGRDNIPNASIEELVGGFYQELQLYKELISSESNGRSTASFYLCDYLGFEKRARWALLRGDKTVNQLLYTKTMTMVIGEVLKIDESIAKIYKQKIDEPTIDSKTLMQTHFPIDLTTKSFRNKALLESHTGVIKDVSMWYTKYYNGKEMVQMPFREDLLYIFGDSYMFHPLSHAYRKTFLELAQKYNWSFATTKEKILYGLDSLKDKYLAETLRGFML